MSDLKLLLSALAAIALILVNGLFVAAELSLVRVRRTRLEELAAQGVVAAKRSLLLVDGVGDYLATTQIGITVASLGVGWFGEDAFAGLFMVILPSTLVARVLLHAVAVVLAFLLITMMHVVLGELVPKNLAIGKAETLLLRIARPLELCHLVLRPVHRLFTGLSSFILRRIGHVAAPDRPMTEAELKLVLMDSHEGGVISEGEAQIIIKAFEFADKRAGEIMIPADRVDFISLSRPFEKNIEAARKNNHTRYPLCSDGLDSVVGVVNMKDVWPLLLIDESNAAFERAARRPIKVPATLSQEGVLKLFQQGHGQMGIVRDEGDKRTLGVVGLEDVLESLVGNVRERKSLLGR